MGLSLKTLRLWAAVVIAASSGALAACAAGDGGASTAPLESINPNEDIDPAQPSGGAPSLGNPSDVTADPAGDGDPNFTGDLNGQPGSTVMSSILSSVRLEPVDPEITIDGLTAGTLDFQVLAILEATGEEIDVTERAVFWVSDNHLLGEFAGNLPTFSTNSLSPRGGVAQVSASIFATPDQQETLTTSLTVRINALQPDPRADGTDVFSVPADAPDLFTGPADPSLGPTLVYPNDSVLLPPNLTRLEVHFIPASLDTSLYEVSFIADTVQLFYHVRCGVSVNEGCALELDPVAFSYLAESTRGGDPIALTVRATDDLGTAVGSSQTIQIQFAQSNVEGAVYYWTTTSPPRILRFDFGALAEEPEVFVETGEGPLPDGNCVGCHALSRDGTKLVASLNGRGAGQQVFIDDLAAQRTDPLFFDLAGDPINVIQFASWNPDGSRFVAVWGDSGNPAVDNMLWMHDGTTGARIPAESMALAFEPDHPDWSPNGEMIAFTHVGIHQTSQRPLNGGIDVIRNTAGVWSAPETIVPIVDDLNQFNPSFVPDSSFFIYTTATCPPGAVADGSCDGDDDPSATTWAVESTAGATPVHLTRAGSPSFIDEGLVNLNDTFPRSSPFIGSYQEGDVFWITFSSRRRSGLRNSVKNQQLWMAAVDPARILAGVDGSFPAFYLPFQDLDTSNHIAQWTARIVSDDPPPPIPDPPPPPEEPVPPPVVQ